MSHEAPVTTPVEGNIPFTSLGFRLGIKSIGCHCPDFCITVILKLPTAIGGNQWEGFFVL